MNKILWIKKLAVLLQSKFYGKENLIVKHKNIIRQ
jgi:hypothetical protein